MKKFWALVAVTGMLTLGGFSQASACSASSESACSKKSEADQVGMTYGGGDKAEAKAGCAATCAKSEADQVNMTYGGGDAKASAEGYEIGQKVPDFSLTDATGKEYKLSEFNEKLVVLVFYNQECPFVVEMRDRLSDFSKTYDEKGVKTFAIDAGDNNKADSIAAHAQKVSFPILVNNDSKMARKFNASKTPEVFILDKTGVVRYHGAFDSGKVEEGQTRKTFTQDAVEELLAGKDVTVQKTKAFGCSLKFNKTTSADAPEAPKTEKTGG